MFSVLCQPLFDVYPYRGLGSITCAELDLNFSPKMDVVSATIFHEWLHWDTLIPQIPTSLISDWNLQSKPGIVLEDGFGPYNCVEPNQFNDLQA